MYLENNRGFAYGVLRQYLRDKFLKTKLPHASKLFTNCFVILRLDKRHIFKTIPWDDSEAKVSPGYSKQ